jgi:hypothetical protein
MFTPLQLKVTRWADLRKYNRRPVQALGVVLLLTAGFVVFCEVDLAQAEEVRYLPKWVWAILCMSIGLTIPFGGIAYLAFGKVRRPRLG